MEIHITQHYCVTFHRFRIPAQSLALLLASAAGVELRLIAAPDLGKYRLFIGLCVVHTRVCCTAICCLGLVGDMKLKLVYTSER